MERVAWEKGFVLAKIKRNDPEIVLTSGMLSKNSGWENLKREPMRPFWIGRYTFPDFMWRNIDDFRIWLQNEFSHLEDGVYVIIAWSGSTRWIKGRHRRVRDFIPFAKFEVTGHQISMTEEHEKTAKPTKTYRIWLMLKERELGGGTAELLPRVRKVKL